MNRVSNPGYSSVDMAADLVLAAERARDEARYLVVVYRLCYASSSTGYLRSAVAAFNRWNRHRSAYIEKRTYRCRLTPLPIEVACRLLDNGATSWFEDLGPGGTMTLSSILSYSGKAASEAIRRYWLACEKF